MSPFNFLAQVGRIPRAASRGFRKLKTLNPISDLRTTGGLVLTGATGPLVAALETNALGVQVAAGTTAAGSFNFIVPKDYDKTADELRINVLCNSAGDTNVPTLTATAYRKRAGAALTAALTVTASAAIPNNTTKAAERTVILTGNLLQAGDAVTINLVTGAHATDAVNIYGVEVQYKSSLVFEDPSTR